MKNELLEQRGMLIDKLIEKLGQDKDLLDLISGYEEQIDNQANIIKKQSKKIIPENINMHNKLNEIRRILEIEKNPMTSEYHYNIVRLVNDLLNIIYDKPKTPEEYIEQNITNQDIARRLQETIQRNMENNNE